MPRRLACLLIVTVFALFLPGCGKPATSSSPAPKAGGTPPSAVTPTPAPTATPAPDDYDEAVDFGDQTALIAAACYALRTDADDITYRALDTIDTLILSDASEITDIGALARAHNLSTLVIVDGAMDLSPLAALPKLATLTVTGGHFGNLKNIAVLPQLTELNLFGYDTTDFMPLTALQSLTTLRIGNHAPCDFSALAALPTLTTLLIPDTRGNDLSWLGGMSELTDLTIWQCKQRYFDWLPKLTKLTSLRLDLRADCDLTPVGSLTGLKALTLDMESGRALDDLSWLKNLSRLETLDLRGVYFSRLQLLSGMENLRSLTLSGTRGTVRLDELPELPALAKLSIHNNSVVSAGSLIRYPKLKALTLTDCTINDARAIYALTSLTALTMRSRADGGDRDLGDISRVAGMVNLEYLDWGGRANDLGSLAALRRLTSLRLSGARIVDWTPLTALSRLESLDLSNNRIKRVPDSVADMASLTSIDLSGCDELHFAAALAAVPRLARVTLENGAIRDLDALAAHPGMTAVTFVSGGQSDPVAGRHTGMLADAPDFIRQLRAASPYVNYAASASVIDRFFLKDYQHAPYYCSNAWYPAFAPNL